MTDAEAQTERRPRLEVHTRKARPADTSALVAVLARAFDDDPVLNWMVMQDARRARRIYDLLALVVRIEAPHQETYTTIDIAGAALWAPPGKWKQNWRQQLATAPGFARATTWRRFSSVLSGFGAIEKKHPKEPHYYLSTLGVEPELQGRGVGTQLIAPVLAMCDRDGVPAYLESSKAKNVPMYERNGFKVTEEFQVPNGGPPIWLMWRYPQ